MQKEKHLVITHPDAVVGGKSVQQLDVNSSYIISVQIGKRRTPEEAHAILNKVEMAFKALGVKNVKAVGQHLQLFKVHNEK